ncbi:MAG: NAD-dependent epimerase/dehydratase family protein [Verrucomicrobiae bacterium]|nr:NAD-dependent epimerase/dehydratase family protein [Verrucomicrobiae bacterium]
MKVLLTGASGFVGSHVLDVLCERGIQTSILIRTSSNRRFIEPHSSRVEVRFGSLDDTRVLNAALQGVTHVVHCAGAVKAPKASEFHRINVGGTRWLVDAINAHSDTVRRLIHVSSLAASGPGTASAPVRESDPPRPVSVYGKSKLDSERVVSESCRVQYVIVRPPAVYGPRDAAFLALFKAVKRGWCPKFGSRFQELSLVYVRDLAEVVVSLLTHERAGGLTVNVACEEVVTDEELCRGIADVLGVRLRRIAVPLWVLRLVCQVSDIASSATGRASIIGLDKYRELTAPGWVCDTSVLREKLGLVCPTRFAEGVRATAIWYQKQGWL